MHDCRNLENRLIDLVFDELEADEKQHLLTELQSCDGCLSEYRSVTETLLIFDKGVEVSLPDESYWPQHHAALSQRLETLAIPAAALKPAPFWKRILTARLPLPVPVAAVIAIALLVSSVLALRRSTADVIQAAPQTLSADAAQPRLIEVPVIREKVVTRTVYVEKRMRESNNARRQAPPVDSDGSSLTARNSDRENRQANLFTRVNLTDFQPPDEMRIRIIKRRSLDEN